MQHLVWQSAASNIIINISVHHHSSWLIDSVYTGSIAAVVSVYNQFARHELTDDNNSRLRKHLAEESEVALLGVSAKVPIGHQNAAAAEERKAAAC